MKTFFKNFVVSVLTFEAKLLLRRARPKIIAVTGSVGKTSTKDAIYHAIKDQVSARKSVKSFNSEIGVPLSVLGLDNAWSNPFLWFKNLFDGLLVALFPGKYPDVLVLEMGVDRPGDIARLTEWITPDVVVLTRLPNVPAHVEYFPTPEAVIAEKLTLVDALAADGVLVYNNDDEKIRQIVEGVRQKAVGYSRYSQSQFTATQDEVVFQNDTITGMRVDITHVNETVSVEVGGGVGVQHCYNIAAACAVASIFDVSLEQARESLVTFVPPAGRMRIIKGIKNTLIIDDTYNSSPVAAERALSVLFELPHFKRRIAVMGDMLELGQFSVREHERVGEQVADGADVLVSVGVRARGIAEGAMSHGLSKKVIMQYDEAVRAGRELQNFIQPGDVILVKGSQGMRMEKIVMDLMAKPDLSDTLLVRQSRQWQKKI